MTDERLIPHTRAAERKAEELFAAAELLHDAGLDPKSDIEDSAHEEGMELMMGGMLKDLNSVISAIEGATGYDGDDLLDTALWAANRAQEEAYAQRSPEGARQRAERARAAADEMTELLGYAIEGAGEADLPAGALSKVNSDISTKRHAARRWDELAEAAQAAIDAAEAAKVPEGCPECPNRAEGS